MTEVLTEDLAESTSDFAAEDAEPAESSLLVTFGGEATAVGTDTLAQGDLFSRVLDKGPVAIAFGSARFTATAQGESGDAVLASADTFFDSTGADIVRTFEMTSSRTQQEDGETTTTETSFLKFLAIDIENLELPDRPLEDETASQSPSGFEGFGAKDPQLDGNVATLTVDAEAEGTDTLVDVQADVLAVEDQLSTVASVVTTGVG